MRTNIDVNDRLLEGGGNVYFDFRKSGISIRSPIDCCIASIAIENNNLNSYIFFFSSRAFLSAFISR